MDPEGKDTDTAWKSGANAVFIVDTLHSAEIVSGPVDVIRQKTSLLNCDIVLIEGFKKALVDKIVVIDKDKKILEMSQNGVLDGVVAFVGQEKSSADLPKDVPYFHRDDVDCIVEFVLSRFQNKIDQTPLYGLVLAGGRSKRMPEDKSLISYHDRPQAEVCYKLLSDT